jgi:glycosyltransferase involved in cell wall biosynthesis
MRIAFYSTMTGMLWGGSEELWRQAAAVLLERGHHVAVNYRRRPQLVPRLDELASLGASVHYRSAVRVGRTMRGMLKRLHCSDLFLQRWLKAESPDYVLISAGYHIDDLSVASTCAALGIPYGILLQAASPHQWVDSRQLPSHRSAYQGAADCFFVSQENRDIMETNLAIDLTGARVIDNPFNVSTDAAPAWPTNEETWKIACVARLAFQSKGQDLLIHALRRPKWRERNVEITLYGEDGGSRTQCERLIELYRLQKQIKFGGFVSNIHDVWKSHHALVLPSRFEGNPLALIEGMMCGRPPIVTNVGRVAELVDDNRSGFIAEAATTALIDEALERAWQRRHEWQSIGAIAATDIRNRHSMTPAADFADAILEAIHDCRRRPLARAA